MNKYYVNNNFHGAIDGKRAVNYYREVIKMDRGNAKENIEKIKEILGIELINDEEFTDDFWIRVFFQDDRDEMEGGVKLILNKDDSLYSDSNIAKTLELMGTVILSGEKKKDNPEGYIRVFHSKEMFKKALDEQNAIKHIAENTPDGKYALEKGLDDLFVLANQMNYKLEKRFNQLDDKHLEKLDKEFGSKYPQVHDYYVGYLTMKDKLKEMTELKKSKGKLTNEERSIYKLLKNNVRSLKEDFLDCIDKKARPIVFKAPLPDKGNPEWDEYDDLNKEHLRALLQVSRGNDLSDDLSVIVQDLNNTIDECDFTKKQSTILYYIKEGKTQSEIANILKIDQSTVNNHLKAIVNKIYNKNLEKYLLWYKLNVVRGEYKICNDCQEIKLVDFFRKKGKQGFVSRCKSCESKARGK